MHRLGLGPGAWLRHVLLFFSWGFAMHAAGLLLHELGGHGLVMAVAGCGIERWELSYFGHGSVDGRSPCPAWTTPVGLVGDWAGIAVCLVAATVAFVAARRCRSELARLLFLLVAYFFGLGQLGYAVSGGFLRHLDPAATARLLDRWRLGWLAWLLPLVPYLGVAWVVADRAVEAFRRHFASASRGVLVAQLLATLGVAGAGYAAALHLEYERSDGAVKRELEREEAGRRRAIERQVEAETGSQGRPVSAERLAEIEAGHRPFPVARVLYVVAALGVLRALMTRRPPPEAGREVPAIPPRVALAVHLLAAGLAVVDAVLIAASAG